MQKFNLLTRRAFLDRNFKIGFGVALSTLVDIPLVVKRALAEGTIGVPGPDGKIKKLLFIFLRGANDALNSLIPIQDPAYNLTNRPTLMIPADPGTDYSALGGCDFPQSSSAPGDANYATYYYANAIRLGNGFAALHPSLKFLAPVYNSGDLALLHRVAYPKQSRSHFDSQNYWENGIPNDNVLQEGILYRAMIESGLAASAPLTGVSIQSALPLILRGSAAAMTNLTDPTRYNLLGIPNTAAGNANADSAIQAANFYPFPSKQNRELLSLQYRTLHKPCRSLRASISQRPEIPLWMTRTQTAIRFLIIFFRRRRPGTAVTPLMEATRINSWWTPARTRFSQTSKQPRLF